MGVCVENTLDRNKPNLEKVLNIDVALWWYEDNESNEEEDGGRWICNDDACPHRYAPLSEGRIVLRRESGGEEESNNNKNKKKKEQRCIQCSYHGWEFDDEGTCRMIPQL